jgi:hypothetical protein
MPIVPTEQLLIDQLAGIERLLLRPEPAVMREVESRLTGLIADIRESGATEFESGVRGSVRNVRFLLDRAKQFWDRRRIARAPSLQYRAGGVLVENTSESTFAFEV